MKDTNTQQQKAEKTGETAKRLYPLEKFEIIENGIFIAKSRMPRSAEQVNVLEKELRQARILVGRGSTVYLLSENPDPNIKKVKFPDAVVDGLVMEFKTITGGIRQVESRYKEARIKAENIFLLIVSPLSKHDFTRKLSGYIKRKGYSGGHIFAFFAANDEFYQWSEDELSGAANGQKKSGSYDPAAIQGKSD